jgi:PGF-pre-PGF domain-containing protein
MEPTYTPAPDPTPSTRPTLSESFDAGYSGGDDILPGLSTTPDSAGEGPLVCQTVNVGGDSAIHLVTVKGKNISGLIVTGNKLESIPTGFPKLPFSVYQYVDVTPAQFSVITDVQLEFGIPLESMSDQNITEKEVRMYLFQNSTWVALPTNATGTKNGRALYRSESPEFSLFAITINNKPFSQTQGSAITISPDSHTVTKEHNGDSGVLLTTNLPVQPTPDTSASERPVRSFFSGIMVIITIMISAVLIRHWWIRRQNPP